MSATAGGAPAMHATTILCARRDGRLAMGGDGQVTLGHTVVKTNARKIRRLASGKVLAGFAGATADAFTLLDLFERRLDSCNRNLQRAAEELARDWRTDKMLRRLEAMLIIADSKETFMLSGLGDVIQPQHDVVAIGSGAAYAESAALALLRHAPQLSAAEVVRESLSIAANICIYTNHEVSVEELSSND